MPANVCRHIVRRTGQICGRQVQHEDNACGFHTSLTTTRFHHRHGHGASGSGTGTGSRRRRRREPMGTQQQQPPRSVRTRTAAANHHHHHPIPPATPAPTGDECTICLNDMEPALTRTLICGHAFHGACIDEWENTGRNFVCPLCRHPIGTPTQTPPPEPTAHYYDDFASLPGVNLTIPHTPPSLTAPHTSIVHRQLFASPSSSSVVEVVMEGSDVPDMGLPTDTLRVGWNRLSQLIDESVTRSIRAVFDEYYR
jgi:hypothetical protein